jgi:hypothetical protein
MAQFRQWALQCVLSDDETAQLEITQKAARGEKVLYSRSAKLN